MNLVQVSRDGYNRRKFSSEAEPFLDPMDDILPFWRIAAEDEYLSKQAVPLAGNTRTGEVNIRPADWDGSFQKGLNVSFFGTTQGSQNVALEFLPNIVIVRVFQYLGHESAHPPASLNYVNG